MNKFKDFIYDKNDVIIAAAILIAAALIIWWRLNVILDYPQQLVNSGTDTNVTEITDGGDATDASSVDNADSGDAAGNGDSGDSNDSGDATTEPTETWADGKLTKDVEVNVDGATASAAIQCLIDAGLFDDYADYKSACDSQGLNDEKVSAGTFTFAKGSTKAQIARKVNWS